MHSNTGSVIPVVTTNEIKAVLTLITGNHKPNALQFIKQLPSHNMVKDYYVANADEAWAQLHAVPVYSAWITKNKFGSIEELVQHAINHVNDYEDR